MYLLIIVLLLSIKVIYICIAVLEEMIR